MDKFTEIELLDHFSYFTLNISYNDFRYSMYPESYPSYVNDKWDRLQYKPVSYWLGLDNSNKSKFLELVKKSIIKWKEPKGKDNCVDASESDD